MNNFRKHIGQKFSDYRPEIPHDSLEETWNHLKEALSSRQKNEQRFNNYEPEVSEEKIEEAWNRVSYFLPKEEKKRRFLYLPLGCAVTAGLCFSVCVIFIIAHKFIDHPSPTTTSAINTGNSAQQKKISEKEAQVEKTGSYEESITNQKVVAGVHEIKASQKKIIQKETVAFHETIHKTYPPNTIQHADIATVTMPAKKDNVWFIDAIPTLLGQEIPEINLKQIIAYDTVNIKPKKWSAEILAGMNYPFNSFTINDVKHSSHNTINAGITAALYYKLTPRLLLGSELGIGQNKLNYTETIEGNLVVSQEIVSGVSSVGSIDTLIAYRPFQNTYQLTSAVGYYAGIGIEAIFVSKNRFSLAGSLFMRVTGSQLSYSYEHKPETYTRNFLKTTTSGNLPNAVNETNITNEQFTVQSLSAGLSAGVGLHYKLSTHFSMILKPAMCFNFSEFSKSNSIKFKQNYYSVLVGVRYKW